MKTFIKKSFIVFMFAAAFMFLVGNLIQIGDNEYIYVDNQILYDLDYPQTQLNNHSLREVFEPNNVELTTMANANSSNLGYENGFRKWSNNSSTTNGLDKIFTFIDNNEYYLTSTVKNYNNENYGFEIYTRANTFDYFITRLVNANEERTLSGEVIGNSLNTMFTVRTPNAQSKIFGVKDIYLINKTSLGIDTLTVAQMDYWFKIYNTLKGLE